MSDGRVLSIIVWSESQERKGCAPLRQMISEGLTDTIAVSTAHFPRGAITTDRAKVDSPPSRQRCLNQGQRQFKASVET